MDYRIWAIFSAIFAGLTAILAKKGVEDLPSDLALAIRVVVVLVIAWSIVLVKRELVPIPLKALSILVCSGVATGASWFCYFRALQTGPVSSVAPIDKLSFVIALILGVLLLGERPNVQTWLGAGLICAGVLVTLK